MSLEDNKALSHREIMMWKTGHSDNPDDFLSPDYVNHQDSDVQGKGPRDLKAWKELVAGFHKGFVDSEVEVERQIAEGDLVATHWKITATHNGDYMGLASASGRRFSWTGVLIDRVADGKIAETWVEWDEYGFFKGLGVIPEEG